MTCPICLSIDDNSLVAGLRAGALVLILMASLVIAAAARFAWRLWKTDVSTGLSADLSTAARSAKVEGRS